MQRARPQQNYSIAGFNWTHTRLSHSPTQRHTTTQSLHSEALSAEYRNRELLRCSDTTKNKLLNETKKKSQHIWGENLNRKYILLCFGYALF